MRFSLFRFSSAWINYIIKIALLVNAMQCWWLNYASLRVSFSNTICSYFNIHKDDMFRELVVDIKKVNAIITYGIFSAV